MASSLTKRKIAIMSAVSSSAARAFVMGKRLSKSNTSVRVNHDGSVEMRLFDNLIARHTVEDGTKVTMANWGTMTTRARLNAIIDELGMRGGFWQHKGEQFYGTPESNRTISTREWIQITR